MPIIGSSSPTKTHAQPDNLSPPPTRFYFHAANSTVSGTLPSTEQSSLTADKNVDAQTVNRSMDTTKGTSVASLVLTSNGTTSLQNYYFTKFISPPIDQTAIAANTWSYAFATTETLNLANFPVTAAQQPVYINVYVWRPSTGAKVGTIIDGNTAATANEGVTTNQWFRVLNFNGAAVSGVQTGDVIVCEIWFQVTQGTTSTATDTWYYDGATTYNDKTDSATDAASYLETPEVITFQVALSRVTHSYTLIYNIRKQVVKSNTLKYNIWKQVTKANTLKYNIRKQVTKANTLKYNIRKQVTKSNTLKYNIRKQVTKSNTLKYNIRKLVTKSNTLKYNLRKQVTKSNTLKYNIRKLVTKSNTLKYNIFGRILHSFTLKYNIRKQVTKANTLKYNIRLLVTKQNTLKYNIRQRVTNANTLIYNIRFFVSSSNTLKYNIRQRVTHSNTILWNIIADFTRVARSNTLRYNIIPRITHSQTLKYNLRSRVQQPQTLQYNIRQRVTANATLIYNIRKLVTKSNTLIYNIIAFTRVTRAFTLVYNIIGAPVTARLPAAAGRIDWGRLAQNIVNLTTFHTEEDDIDVQDKLFERLKELKRLVGRIEKENKKLQGAAIQLQVQKTIPKSPPATTQKVIEEHHHYITTRTSDKQKEIVVKPELLKEIHTVKEQADTITKVIADNQVKTKTIVKEDKSHLKEKLEARLNRIYSIMTLHNIIDLLEKSDDEADT